MVNSIIDIDMRDYGQWTFANNSIIFTRQENPGNGNVFDSSTQSADKLSRLI